MYLPTTKDGMNAAIGWYIHDFAAAGMIADAAKHAASITAAKAADPNWTPEPFVWDKKFTKPKKTNAQSFADYIAEIRARKS